MNKDTELLPYKFMPNEIEISHGWYGVHDDKTTTYVRKDTRPNTPQSSEVDVSKLKLNVEPPVYYDEEEISPHINAYLQGMGYDNAIDYLNSQGYLKTPAENVRCDTINAQLDEVIELCQRINEIADKGTPNKYNDWLDQHSRMEILSRDALTKLKSLRDK